MFSSFVHFNNLNVSLLFTKYLFDSYRLMLQVEDSQDNDSWSWWTCSWNVEKRQLFVLSLLL